MFVRINMCACVCVCVCACVCVHVCDDVILENKRIPIFPLPRLVEWIMCRVGQDRIYTPHMTVFLVISLP
jgi:hypothetical protein